jgi:hypothetical protein
VRYTAGDNVGIRSARLLLGGRQVSKSAASCNYARPTPCPSGPGDLRVETFRVTNDGRYSFAVEARDTAGNVSSAPGTALIDNTAPSRVAVGVTGGDGWRRVNNFSVNWTAPAERFAPVTAALTKLCPSTRGACTRVRHARAGIMSLPGLAVRGPGDWTLEVWRQDAAGNAAESQASSPVHLRFDPEPPQLGFEQQAMADPTRISVLVNDRVSGLARGEIELRRQGTSAWQSPRTTVSGTRLLARLDDSRLAPGTYELRARAIDRAGNESSTTSRLDGAPMVLRLPVRFAAVIDAGVKRRLVVRRQIRRHGRRRTIRRRVVREVPIARVRLGRLAKIAGTLRNADGQPLPGATIYVYSRTVASPESLMGAVRTDTDGRFSYTARATTSRVLRFIYAGTSLALPAQREVSLRVPAASTIHVSRRRARNGQGVTFRGRVRGGPLPALGKLVEVQAHFRGRWRTFSTVRTDAGGRWRFRYRFGGTVGRVRYRFRALLPAEAGYPFEGGRSRILRVFVHG